MPYRFFIIEWLLHNAPHKTHAKIGNDKMFIDINRRGYRRAGRNKSPYLFAKLLDFRRRYAHADDQNFRNDADAASYWPTLKPAATQDFAYQLADTLANAPSAQI